MTTRVPHYVGGEWAFGASVYEKSNPSKSRETAVVAPDGSPQDALTSIDRASAAFREWAALSPSERGGYLTAAADLLTSRAEVISADIAEETGMTVTDARADVASASAILRYTAQLSDESWTPIGAASGTLLASGSRPLGVVAQVSPWNVPLASAAWKVAPALLAGNAVVLKVASESPHAAFHFASSCDDAGLPTGVLSVLTGQGGALGGTLITDPRVAAMSWTGTDLAVAGIVRDNCMANGKRLQLQLGGINSLVVLEDADLELAAAVAVTGAFSHAGQLRTATRRVIVARSVLARFRELLLEKTGALVVGSAQDETTELGPVVNAVELAAIDAAVGARQERGDRLLTGGRQIGDDAYLYAPTVLEVDDANEILEDDEVFGPVVTIAPCDDFEHALRVANTAPRVLSAGIVTHTAEFARAFERECRAGLVHVNGPTTGPHTAIDPRVPLAGDRFTTIGPAELGEASLDFYRQRFTSFRREEGVS